MGAQAQTTQAVQPEPSGAQAVGSSMGASQTTDPDELRRRRVCFLLCCVVLANQRKTNVGWFILCMYSWKHWKRDNRQMIKYNVLYTPMLQANELSIFKCDIDE